MAKKKTALKVASKKDQVFKFHISLDDTQPIVWRRILVPGSFTLEALHSVIQLTMGWQMTHLYDFEIDGQRHSEPDDFDELEAKPLGISLDAVLKNQKEFSYNYDFGDGWRHSIAVEEVAPRDEMFSYPICIAGENACPPEDCGGIPGFEELKKTIANPKHPEYREMMRWLGGYYTPFSFDANRINRDLLGAVNWKADPNDQGLYHPYNIEEDASH